MNKKFKKGQKVKTRKGDIETVKGYNSNGNVWTEENDYSWPESALELVDELEEGKTYKSQKSSDNKSKNFNKKEEERKQSKYKNNLEESKKLNKLISLVEQYTGKKVVLKEAKVDSLINNFGIKIRGAIRNGDKKLENNLKAQLKIALDKEGVDWRTNPYSAEILGESKIIKENTFNTGNPDKDKVPSVKMTTSEFEKNTDKVNKIVKKGFDVKLTDLQEDEGDFYDEYDISVEEIANSFENGQKKQGVYQINNFEEGKATFFEELRQYLRDNPNGNEFETFADIVVTYFSING